MLYHRLVAVSLVAAAAVTPPAAAQNRVHKASFADRVLPTPVAPSGAVLPFLRYAAGHLALTHVRVIDGTGTPPVEDATVLLDGARIVAVQPAATALPAGTTAIDLTGDTVLPGLVGMHDHLYYIDIPDRLTHAGKSPPMVLVPEMPFSSPRLYLANGVTTMRTTGSVEPYTDLNLKAAIDAGQMPGPHIDVTAPYLEGKGSYFIQMPALRDAEDARQTVNFWADHGATSSKAYMNITKAELGAAIKAAHARGLKLTGHLCAVSYPEAAALGIDNLEHGFFVNTQLDPGKKPDTCSSDQGEATLAAMAPETPEAKALIALLVAHHVAVTSTLPVFEDASPNYVRLTQAELDVLTPEAREDYLRLRLRTALAKPDQVARLHRLWANELGLERAFVAAGGLLLAGPDPTGAGNVIPGFGDLHEVELLVEAGFTPTEAIRIATLNGATYEGLADRLGSIAAGKNADLLVVRGNPATSIGDIRAVQIVFKDGVGYDPAKLLASVRGHYGRD